MGTEPLFYKSSAYEKSKEWKRKPWLYLEEIIGVKLHWWQKIYLLWMGVVERWKNPMLKLNKYIK